MGQNWRMHSMHWFCSGGGGRDYSTVRMPHDDKSLSDPSPNVSSWVFVFYTGEFFPVSDHSRTIYSQPQDACSMTIIPWIIYPRTFLPGHLGSKDELSLFPTIPGPSTHRMPALSTISPCLIYPRMFRPEYLCSKGELSLFTNNMGPSFHRMHALWR